jgi:hypothetical protein
MSFIDKLEEAATASVESRKAKAITAISTALFLVAMILLSFPGYSYQLLSTNPLYIPTAMEALTINLYNSAGLLAVILTLIYSLVGGITITNVVQQLKFQGGGLKNAGMLTPAIAISGCAGCGAGVLGLIGLTGALAVLPFEGNLFRLGGIGLLVYFLGKSGHPKKCET